MSKSLLIRKSLPTASASSTPERSMKVQKTTSFALALLPGAASALAQQTTQNEAPMTNKDVLQMISMGLSEGVIVDKIHATKATNFDISMDTLKSLKDAKVPDALVQAMIQASSVAHASDQPAAPNPDDPATPLSPVRAVW